MALKMKEKFDKYWGNIDKVNMMLLIAILLDPRFKLRYARLWYADIYEFGKAEELVSRLIVLKLNISCLYKSSLLQEES